MRAENGDVGLNPCCTGNLEIFPGRENGIEPAAGSPASHGGAGVPVCQESFPRRSAVLLVPGHQHPGPLKQAKI